MTDKKVAAEDKKVEKKITIFFSEAKEYPALMKNFEKGYQVPDDMEVRYAVPLVDIQAQVVTDEKKFIVVINNAAKDDLTGAARFLMSIKKEIDQQKVVVLIFQKVSSEKIEELLKKAGCAELLRYDLNIKAFAHKLKRFVALLESSNNQSADELEFLNKFNAKDSQSNQEITQKNASVSKSGPFKVNEFKKETYSIAIVPQSAHQTGDFWMFRKATDAKKVLGKWFIEMVGPSPTVGKWELVEDSWQWKARTANSLFDTKTSYWSFKGLKPEYSWVVNRWCFVSEYPQLAFVENDKIVKTRFDQVENNILFVNDNSAYSISIFDQIKATFDKNFYISVERLVDKTFMIPNDEDNSIPWNDRQDSKALTSADWNLLNEDLKKGIQRNYGDLSASDPSKPWGRSKATEAAQAAKTKRETAEVDALAKKKKATEDEKASGSKPLGFKDEDPAKGPKNLSLHLAPEVKGSKNLSLHLDPAVEGAKNLRTYDNTNPAAKKKKEAEEPFLEEITEEEYDFPIGAEAMKSCGLTATIGKDEVEFIGYSESKNQLTIGIPTAIYQEKEFYEVDVNSEGLSLSSKFSLKGQVVSAEPKDESNQMVVQLNLNADSSKKFFQMKEAIDQRQAEIFSFFKLVKGTG